MGRLEEGTDILLRRKRKKRGGKEGQEGRPLKRGGYFPFDRKTTVFFFLVQTVLE